MCDVIERKGERVGSDAHALRRRTSPSQNIACQAEQAATAFGLNHVLGAEAEAVKVFDQRGALARVGNSGGLKRIEIDHPPKSASSEATIRVDSREGL